MKEVIKSITYAVFVTLIVTSFFIGLNENRKVDERRFQLIVEAFEDVEAGFQEQKKVIEEQNKIIEQYKRDCENITFKVINGEW